MNNKYWFDEPQCEADHEGVMLTGVRVIRKSEAVDIMNNQQEQIDALTQDKQLIIANLLNVLAEHIKSVPVSERDRKANIKMRDAILNMIAHSIEVVR